jgi:Flp pilus assembly protein TadG
MRLVAHIADRLRSRRLARLRAFGRDDRGVTLIEFALLAVPFFAITGAVLETSLVFLASQVLDSAVQDSSRLIRTGQAQNASYTADNFRTAICNGLFNLFNCANLQIKVSIVSDFASATTTSPLNPTDPTKWTLVPTYSPGVGSQIIMVQVYYKWPVILNFGGLNLATSSDGTHLLGSVRVFENEPFS